MSIKQFLAFASVALILLVTGSAAVALYTSALAEQRLARAVQSYEQLATATGLEAQALRAMLAELQSRSGGSLDDAQRSDRSQVDGAIDTLIARTREEISSSDDAEEQAAEAREFVAAFSLREDFARLYRALDGDGQGSGALDSTALARFGAVSAQLGAVLRDEREEVAAVTADLERLRNRVWSFAALCVAGAVLAVLFAAGLLRRYIAVPFAQVESGSSQLAAGDISHRIPMEGPPELRNLSRRLNEMAERLEIQRNELRDSNERLEVIVAKRTAELADKADRLQRIDDSRRLFFAKIGHELRTPLTVLLGEAEVALQSPRAREESYREALDHIRVHGDQLQRRIADLLTLARADDGRLAVEPESVDIAGLLRETVDSARGYARVHDVTLRLQADPADIIATADGDRLRQALMALMDNAIKFSPPAGIVDLGVEVAGDGLRLSVADRGPGVPESELDKITRAYFQGEQQPARAGTGLGLAVAQWIAEQHGGRLEAANRDDGGLIVAIFLPGTPDAPVGTGAAVSLSSAP